MIGMASSPFLRYFAARTRDEATCDPRWGARSGAGARARHAAADEQGGEARTSAQRYSRADSTRRGPRRHSG